MAFGAYIIGDEILSGKRQDKHLAKVIELLGARGLRLAWARYLGDERGRLVQAFRDSLAEDDIVFSFGGIGSTPDDHTRQAAAAALGVDIALHPEAEQEIRARFGADITPARLMMGEFPVGARIIPNPYNRIPGFAVGQHHFLPGFPVMAWPMMEWVLDTHYAHLFHQNPVVERSYVLWETYEGQMMELLARLARDFADLRLFSLPSFGDATTRRHVEIGVEGEAGRVAEAMAVIHAEVTARGIDYEARERRSGAA